MSRYSRHIILSEIGQAGQNKLSKAKVLVVGAGGLGCPILQYLAAAGNPAVLDLVPAARLRVDGADEHARLHQQHADGARHHR